MFTFKPFFLIFSWACLTAAAGDPSPAAIYYGDANPKAETNITLRIGNGGAGQSGLVKGDTELLSPLFYT